MNCVDVVNNIDLFIFYENLKYAYYTCYKLSVMNLYHFNLYDLGYNNDLKLLH